jgi:hypothetical protein
VQTTRKYKSEEGGERGRRVKRGDGEEVIQLYRLQVAALPLLDYDYAQREAKAIQDTFRAKRDFVVKRLNDIGMRVHAVPRKYPFLFPLSIPPLSRN